MTRPSTPPMPRHAARYFDRQADQVAPRPQPLKPRYIATPRRIAASLPRILDGLFLCIAALGLVGFYLREELDRWIDTTDWERADRALLFGLKFFVGVAVFYIVWVVMTAWARGDFDWTVR